MEVTNIIGTAKTKLAILSFLYCEEVVKKSNDNGEGLAISYEQNRLLTNQIVCSNLYKIAVASSGSLSTNEFRKI